MVFALTSVGCGHANSALPPKIPALALDLEASESRSNVPDDTQSSMRSFVGSLIREMDDRRESRSQSMPARFLATVRLERSAVPVFFPCFLFLALVGCPARASAQAAITLDVGHTRYVGYGSATRWATVYHIIGGYDAVDEAMSQAIVAAVMDAAEKSGKEMLPPVKIPPGFEASGDTIAAPAGAPTERRSPAPSPKRGCTKDSDCEGERICENGACVQAPPPPTQPKRGCSKDSDCKGNRICEKGVCVEP